jgi:hypothetical protein
VRAPMATSTSELISLGEDALALPAPQAEAAE